MKRQLSLGLIAAAIATLAWLSMVGSGDGSAPGGASAVGKPPATDKQGDAGVPAGAADGTVKTKTADRFREADRLNLKKFPVQEIAALLSGPEDTARHHIAAFLMTDSREFLDRAAPLFPSSPEVFYQIAVRTNDPGERTLSLKKALSLDPDNSFLQLLTAGDLAINGQRAAATELVKTAFVSSAFESFADPIKTATRELALKAGSSPGEAAILSLRGEPNGSFFELLSSVGRLQETEEFKAAAGEDAASLAVSVAVKFQPLNRTHGTAALLAYRTESTALQRLPGDTPYGNSGMTAAMRLAQIEDETQRLVRNTDVLAQMPDLSDSEWQIYVDKWSRQGQPEAMAWLAQLKAPN